MGAFDPLGDFEKIFGTVGKGAKIGWKLGRTWQANRTRDQIAAEYGWEVAEAVANAIKLGIDPRPILERAKRDKEAAEERARQIANPPNLYGSARWANAADLKGYLKGRDAFDNPSSILLGTYAGEDADNDVPSFVHWDGNGHLLTVATTRSGKALTTIIPNLLRYRGSAIVLDPKGELYEATSGWRAENVGPVYRLAPFDQGTGRPRHGFNPLARVRNQADARTLAENLIPKDRKSPEFFGDDAVALLTGLIRHVLDAYPPARRNLPFVRSMTALPVDSFTELVREMAESKIDGVREAADNVLGKSRERGLPNLRDTLHSKLALFSDEGLQKSLNSYEVDFESLKDRPATVYIDIPFTLMEPYAPWLRIVLLAALDAMERNRAKPAIPVLFVLDEFLALGSFPEFRNAIRTHAGLGARLWFFLQDVGSLEEHYPHAGWRPFFNCEVKQFFGVADPDTADLVGRYLGNTTVAFKSTSASTNTSTQVDGFLGDGGSTGTTVSTGESVQFIGKPLLTPDEVMLRLGAWQEGGWRHGALKIDGVPAIPTRLVVWQKSPACKARIGAYAPAPAKGEEP